ncbi:MAG: metallophosphoesterase [Candidatus Hydrogenedentota bacterium]
MAAHGYQCGCGSPGCGRATAPRITRRQFMASASAATLGGLALPITGCPHPREEEAERWLRFAHITDAQICDEESPARAVRFDPLIDTAWRPQEAYAAHVLDATLSVVNAQHAERPLDFLVYTGDAMELGQYNELRWFLDVFDGKWVVADSGQRDGVERSLPPELNPKLGFQAKGLDQDIPWYAVYGNHDGLAVGNFHIETYAPSPRQWIAPLLRPAARIIGLHAFPDRPNYLWPVDDRSPAVIRGSEEPPLERETLQLQLGKLEAGPIAPDEDRRFVGRQGFVEEHFHTETTPHGHGFTEANRGQGHAYYTARPREDVPLRLIVLDTTSTAPLPGWPFYYGVMRREQFNSFLKPELKAAKEAGEYVLILSHHPSHDFRVPHLGPTVGTLEFRAFLASQPHVLAHLCGHSHRNRVEKVRGQYLEIETASLIDYPQEGRLIEIYHYPASGGFRIDGAMFSHMEDPTLLSAESFQRATIDAEQHRRKAVAEGEARHLAFPSPHDAARQQDWPNGAANQVLEDPFAALPGPHSPEQKHGRSEHREFSIEMRR